MHKKTLDDIDVRSKRVLVRLDLNVPLDAGRRVTDETRILAALPTVRKIIDDGGRAILMSHLGRPSGKPSDRDEFSLAPVAARLSEHLGRSVAMLPDCTGPQVASAVGRLRDGDVCVLENLRFHDAETIKDKDAAKDAALKSAKRAFARQIADLGDAYVNDAFGTCHRDNASMLTVPQLMEGRPRVVGYLVQRELEFLGKAVSAPRRPFVAILGGAKVSDKIKVIESLLARCDSLLVGGAMMFTFSAAEGRDVGASLVEPDAFDVARTLRQKAGDKLVLPVDCIAAERIQPDAATITCGLDVTQHYMGLDIGPQTIEKFRRVLSQAETILWNGPMGVFETRPFDRGTTAIAQALAEATARGAITIVGGGDSAAAVAQAGLSDKVSHVSTGGGASLEFLEGRRFAAIEVLDEA
ncbi:MAG: phosphoglycerate kinase [Phycisphaerales bacterium]|nr:MAG: phosphoglycerate kinase [Phycisphaerales bacterium]